MTERALALLRGNGLSCRSLAPARDGREHHLFRVTLQDGTDRLLKVPRAAGFADPHWPGRTPSLALAAEAAALRLLKGVTGPSPYQVLPGDPPGALMGVVPGTAPEVKHERGEMDPELLESVCHAMGRTLARVHAVRRPTDPGPITDLPGTNAETARLLHMDFHLGNVLGDVQLGRRWRVHGVVDWTCCHWGPREADFAEMGASVFATNPWALDPFLLGYRQESGQALDRARVLSAIAADMRRRLTEDPPTDDTVRHLWEARLEEWR